MSSAEAIHVAGEHQELDLTVRGTRVRTLTAGSGDPLLYLHGSGDLGLWLPALSALAERYRVWRPDHPGFSGSDDRNGIDSIHDLAFFYLDLLDEIEVDEVALVGSSLGGWLAADLATVEPRRVSELVLVGASGVRAEVPTPDVFTLSPAELVELTYHDQDLRSLAVKEAERIEGDAERFEQFLRNRSATAHLGWNPYMHDPKLPERLHRITAATLILWGAQDRMLPLGYAHRWLELLPAAELAIVEDAGHLPLVERPDAALGILRTFLAGGSGGLKSEALAKGPGDGAKPSVSPPVGERRCGP